MVFLKLDFAKAYDKVNWGFLFDVMERVWITKEFIGMVRVLFQEVDVIVYLNGSIIATFKIQCVVRWGCPLAPYIFPLGCGKGLKCNGERCCGNKRR